MFLCLNTGGRTENNAVMHEKSLALLFASHEYCKSRGSSPQTVPSSSPKGTRPVWPNFPTNNRVNPHSWQQITDQPHDTKQYAKQSKTRKQNKTRIHTCVHTKKYQPKQPYTKKARATYGMLARTSTTSLACAQFPKLSLMRLVTGFKPVVRTNQREIWCHPAWH